MQSKNGIGARGPRADVAARWGLAAVVLFAVVVRGVYFDRPFERDPEGCGSFYGLLARNYLRYSFAETKGVPVQSLWGPAGRLVFYPNHPPLLPLLIAGTYRLCGFDPSGLTVPADWQTRLSTILFTLADVLLVYWLLARRVNARSGVFAAFFFASAPLVVLYGGQPDVINSQLVCFALLTVAAYERFVDRPGVGRLALVAVAFLPAALTDWVAFYLIVVFGIHFLFTQRVRLWGWGIALGVIACAIFAGEYAQDEAVTGRWNWMGELVARRALSNVADSKRTITAMSWVRDALIGHGVGRHGWVMVALGVGWVVVAARRRWKARRREEGAVSPLLHPGGAEAGVSPLFPDRMIELLLGWAGLHILVGRQGVLVHEWWWWPLTPGLAMGAGVALDALCGWATSRGIRSWQIGAVLCLGMVALAADNTYVVAEELAHPHRIVFSDLDYGITEIGRVIRESSPPGSAVMLAESDDSLSLWFYGDRALKRNVWWVGALDERMRDGVADVPFGLTQAFEGRVAAVIVPKAYLSVALEPLVAELRRRYPERDGGKFLVFEIPGRGRGGQSRNAMRMPGAGAKP